MMWQTSCCKISNVVCSLSKMQMDKCAHDMHLNLKKAGVPVFQEHRLLPLQGARQRSLTAAGAPYHFL